MTAYKYRPLRFYATCFAATWTFWIAAANREMFFEKEHIGNLLNSNEERLV